VCCTCRYAGGNRASGGRCPSLTFGSATIGACEEGRLISGELTLSGMWQRAAQEEAASKPASCPPLQVGVRAPHTQHHAPWHADPSADCSPASGRALPRPPAALARARARRRHGPPAASCPAPTASSAAATQSLRLMSTVDAATTACKPACRAASGAPPGCAGRVPELAIPRQMAELLPAAGGCRRPGRCPSDIAAAALRPSVGRTAARRWLCGAVVFCTVAEAG
jgi:hypothetical protein